jgi:hypothetical protein
LEKLKLGIRATQLRIQARTLERTTASWNAADWDPREESIQLFHGRDALRIAMKLDRARRESEQLRLNSVELF